MAAGRPTARQERFARCVVEGMNPSEAYRAAGYSTGGMSAASVATEASRLMGNPNVSPIIEKGRADAMESAVWCRERAIERLQAVNDACYSRLVGGDGERLDKDALGGFLGTLDKLNALCCVGEEVAGQRLRMRGDPSAALFGAP